MRVLKKVNQKSDFTQKSYSKKQFYSKKDSKKLTAQKRKRKKEERIPSFLHNFNDRKQDNLNVIGQNFYNHD